MNKTLISLIICITLISCDFASKQNTKGSEKEMRWYVQFAIDTNNQDSIISALKGFNSKLLVEPVKTEITSAQVHCFEGKMLILKDTVNLKKQEFKNWKTAIYYFNWDESLADTKNISTIIKIRESLNKSGLKVKMIDYGLLERLE